LIRHGLHIKWRVQQFFYRFVYIHCRGDVFTEPLRRNDKGIHIQAQIDGRDLWSAPLRWIHVPWYTHQVSWRLVQAFKG
jgi:hypothetical protein